MTEREVLTALLAWAEAFEQDKKTRGEFVPAQLAQAIAEGERVRDSLPHRCALPASIVEALNSGDGTYRP